MKKLILAIGICFIGISLYSSNSTTTIKGNRIDLKGKMVYLKNYDHFSYSDNNYILDSCEVKDNGDFKFEIIMQNPMLVIVSDNTALPPSYSTLREAPDLYFYSFCATHFGFDPTLFIEPNQNYEITEWNAGYMQAIKYAKNNNNLLRNFYLESDYLNDLLNERKDEFLNIGPERAWQIIKAQKDQWVKKLNQYSTATSEEFKSYYTTEVELGAINNFLLWYDNQTFFEKDHDFYFSFLESYTSKTWHPSSLEYFKLSERFVAYQMSKNKEETKIYYPVSDQKFEFAKRYISPNVSNRYLSNLKRLQTITTN